MIADLVLLDAKPVEDIENTNRISAVFVEGSFYDREALEILLSEVASAADQSTNDWPR